MEAARRKAIIVLGMHRSGTSAITRVMSLLGAALPVHTLGAGPGNEAGHWEPEQLLNLNDRLLAAGGSRWDDWRKFDFGIVPANELSTIRAEIKATLIKEYGDNRLTVLKEPRLCRLMPLYDGVLRELDISPLFVLPIRNPLAVISSLHARNNMTAGFAALLWLSHVLDAESFTRARPRSVLSYERLLADWRPAMRQVSARIGLLWPSSFEDAAPQIETFLSRDMHHHAPSRRELEARADIADWVKQTYSACLSLERDADDEIAIVTLDRVNAEFESTAPIFAHAMFEELAARETNFTRAQEMLAAAVQSDVAARDAAHREELAAEQARQGQREDNQRHAHEIAVKNAVASHERIIADLAAKLEQRAKDLAAAQSEGARSEAGAGQLREMLLAMQQQVSALARERDAVQANLDELRRAAEDWEAQRQAAQRDLDDRNAEIARLKLRLEKKSMREAEIARLEAGTADLKREVIARTAEVASLEDENHHLKFELRGVLDSTTWRLTRPIRQFAIQAPRFRKLLRQALSRTNKAFLLTTTAFNPMNKDRRNTQIVSSSPLFDGNWYLSRNTDVQEANHDPAHHYLHYGAAEGRDPSPHFSTGGYLADYADVREAGVNPLLHYELYGRAENRVIRPVEVQTRSIALATALDLLAEQPRKCSLSTPVTIIVPVYNGRAHLDRLLPSLFKNTEARHPIIFVDDCSTDESILPLLKRALADRANAKLLRNEVNLGFVRTVNRAAGEVNGHFVILNTDTEVPTGWLERIMAPLIADPKVASVTPFSNAATVFSFPDTNADNPLLTLGLEEIDGAFEHIQVGDDFPLCAPSGVGFCMAINGPLWKEIGGFDAETFSKGYGEENDWCQRAVARGYKNVLAPNLFVFHAHGGSFTPEAKRTLMERNLQLLFQRWPNYDSEVHALISKDPWKPLRSAAFLKLCCNNKPTIIFDHALGGGANDYREQLIADRLAEGQPCILVTYSEAGGGLELTARLGATTYKLAMESSAELTNLPPFTRGAEIVYNNIVGWPHTDEALESLTLLARRRNVYARILIHDYYPVCPSYTLLDKNDVFCGVPADTRACEACLRSNRHAATQADIISWRGGWRRLFDASAEVVCFSEASAALVLRSYPDLRTPVVVRPHRALTSYDARQSWTPPNGPLVIGAFGDFGFQKGAQVLSQMAKLLEGHSPHAKIVIFGSIDPAWHEARPNMVIHGRYRREEIPDLLRRYSVAVCVVPSIWPETFSYVTQELMLLGVPLASFNIGAQGERIQHYKRGAVAPGFTALSLLDTVTTLHDRNRQVT